MSAENIKWKQIKELQQIRFCRIEVHFNVKAQTQKELKNKDRREREDGWTRKMHHQLDLSTQNNVYG